MPHLSKPYKISSFMPYCKPSIERLDNLPTPPNRQGGTCENGWQCWLYQSSHLEVLDCGNGNCISSWNWKKDSSATIVGVDEFSSHNSNMLVMAISTTTNSFLRADSGLLYLYDPAISRVVKAIELPFTPTFVSTMTTDGGPTATPANFGNALRLFFGVVALGAVDGSIYLLDMGMDDQSLVCDESCPRNVQIIDAGTTADYATLRSTARKYQMHLCLRLGAKFQENGKFCYFYSDFKQYRSFSKKEAEVTCLKYIQQINCIVAGLKFGGIQFYNLKDYSLIHSVNVFLDDTINGIPITHFVYQEPEDDPKPFCYLWAASGSSLKDSTNPSSSAVIKMYQLKFSQREKLTERFYYMALESCHPVFTHTLSSNCYSLLNDANDSRLISCFAIERPIRDNDGVNVNSTLAAFIWESYNIGSSASPVCYIGIFNINVWYHMHLPSYLNPSYVDKSGACPFFAFTDMTEVAHSAIADNILVANINRRKLTRYQPSSNVATEQTSWPWSLSFDTLFVMDTGLIEVESLGVQLNALATLNNDGPSALRNPQDIFQAFGMAGILPASVDTKTTNAAEQRLAILTTCLEEGSSSFISSCIKTWSNIDYSKSGCSLRLVLEWAWLLVNNYKNSLDELCEPIFDGRALSIGDSTYKTLRRYSGLFRYLTLNFCGLIDYSDNTTEQGVAELESKLQATLFINEWLDVLLWLLGNEILPEVAEEVASSDTSLVCFPTKAIFAEYLEARRQLLYTDQGELRTCDTGLMIDGIIALLKSPVDEIWGPSANGRGVYPPPSLHALLNIYFIHSPDVKIKHSIIFYALLDLGKKYETFSDLASEFAIRFGLEKGLTKLLYGLWLLDGHQFDLAVETLRNPVINVQIAEWQNERILRTLLRHNRLRLCLQYYRNVQLQTRISNNKRLVFEILIANGLVAEALSLQPSDKDLFYYILEESDKYGHLTEISGIISSDEDIAKFTEWLEKKSHPSKYELLVDFYVQRGRYPEAVAAMEGLTARAMDAPNYDMDRLRSMNIAINGIKQTIPNIHQKLLSIKSPHTPNEKFTKDCTPLSVDMKYSQFSNRSSTEMLGKIVTKVEEVRRSCKTRATKFLPFISPPLLPSDSREASPVSNYGKKDISDPESLEKILHRRPAYSSYSQEQLSRMELLRKLTAENKVVKKHVQLNVGDQKDILANNIGNDVRKGVMPLPDTVLKVHHITPKSDKYFATRTENRAIGGMPSNLEGAIEPSSTRASRPFSARPRVSFKDQQHHNSSSDDSSLMDSKDSQSMDVDIQEESISDKNDLDNDSDDGPEVILLEGTPLTTNDKVTARRTKGESSVAHPSRSSAVASFVDDNEDVSDENLDPDNDSNIHEMDIIPSLKDNPDIFRISTTAPVVSTSSIKEPKTPKTLDSLPILNSEFGALDSTHDKSFRMKLRSSDDISMLSSELSPTSTIDLSARSILSSTLAMAHYRVPQHYRSILEHSPRVTRSMSKKLAKIASGKSSVAEPSFSQQSQVNSENIPMKSARKMKSNYSRIPETNRAEIETSKKASSNFSNSPLSFKMPAKILAPTSSQPQKTTKKGVNLRTKSRRKSARR
ncbi:Protein ELYS [Trichoplax sp. H2]|nr:Protein ELYS [Trichoplax sp. H2]|eukprot:RDD44223.1 Protein ELYS [Trichoplax sp. H2]